MWRGRGSDGISRYDHAAGSRGFGDEGSDPGTEGGESGASALGFGAIHARGIKNGMQGTIDIELDSIHKRILSVSMGFTFSKIFS